MPKKRILELKIDHLRYPDKGIAFLEDGSEIAVKHGFPGQLVEAECIRKRRQWQGRILKILEPAPEESDAVCPDFGLCGGCSFLSIPYERELELKREMVACLLCDYDVPPVVPSPGDGLAYRNKMEFSFGDGGQGTSLALGIRRRMRHYEVTVPGDCALIPDDFKDITLATLAFFQDSAETFYHRMRRTGTLRYLVLRRGEFTGELLVNLVTTSVFNQELLEGWKNLMLALPLVGKVTGVLHTISDTPADAVVPELTAKLWGSWHFYEEINGLRFGISPYSFFQTNSAGAELLYKTVAEFSAKGAKVESVYDLYCGTGTIAQVLAPHAREVVGVDIVGEAIEAAEKNALANGIDNCCFIADDVLKFLAERENIKGRPDVLILDPPRAGIHPKALPKLIELGAPRIVYISCKPSSLARDLPAFSEGGYRVTALRLHDMFPRTPHVETVVLLCRDDM